MWTWHLHIKYNKKVKANRYENEVAQHKVLAVPQ